MKRDPVCGGPGSSGAPLCGREPYAKGLCAVHYRAANQGRKLKPIRSYGSDTVNGPSLRFHEAELKALKREAKARRMSVYGLCRELVLEGLR